MKTLVTILALQLLVGASAFAEGADDNSVADVGVQTSVATVQSGGNFNEDREETRSKVDKFLASLEEGGAGGVGGGRSRTGNTYTPRPTGNEWGERGAANK